MTNVLVFSHKMTGSVLAKAHKVANDAAGDYFTAFAANGPSPTGSAYVAIDDCNPPRVIVDRVRDAVNAWYRGGAK